MKIVTPLGEKNIQITDFVDQNKETFSWISSLQLEVGCFGEKNLNPGRPSNWITQNLVQRIEVSVSLRFSNIK